MKDFFNELRLYLRAAADLALPRCCTVCGRPLHMREEVLCLPCRIGLPYTHFETLSHNPMADRLNGILQRQRPDGAPFDGYARAAALLYYNESTPYRRIPQALKYHRDFGCGEHFGRMLGDRLGASPLFGDVDCLVPVPLHWTRRRRRGYNQAAVIALAAKGKEAVFADLLRRRRRTSTQVRLGSVDKARNVSHAFEIRKKALERYLKRHGMPKHVLIIDDVFTTGATVAACYTALREVLPTSVRLSVATLSFVGRI